MSYLFFSLAFMGLHTFAYMAAGMIAFNISSDLYQGKERLLDFLVDPEEEGAGGFTLRKVIPAQVLRGLIMSLVLYPLLGFLGEISFPMRFLFFGGLMFVYTDLSSAAPFPSNLEGLVYMKKKYVNNCLLQLIIAENGNLKVQSSAISFFNLNQQTHVCSSTPRITCIYHLERSTWRTQWESSRLQGRWFSLSSTWVSL